MCLTAVMSVLNDNSSFQLFYFLFSCWKSDSLLFMLPFKSLPLALSDLILCPVRWTLLGHVQAMLLLIFTTYIFCCFPLLLCALFSDYCSCYCPSRPSSCCFYLSESFVFSSLIKTENCDVCLSLNKQCKGRRGADLTKKLQQ